jgi:hypothetical protein
MTGAIATLYKDNRLGTLRISPRELGIGRPLNVAAEIGGLYRRDRPVNRWRTAEFSGYHGLIPNGPRPKYAVASADGADDHVEGGHFRVVLAAQVLGGLQAAGRVDSEKGRADLRRLTRREAGGGGRR